LIGFKIFHAYTEDQLVEQPAIGLFAGLVWLPQQA